MDKNAQYKAWKMRYSRNGMEKYDCKKKNSITQERIQQNVAQVM